MKFESHKTQQNITPVSVYRSYFGTSQVVAFVILSTEAKQCHEIGIKKNS